jgi:uncharacterized protein (DUF1697 family)
MKYVALLRGINVGGNHRVEMKKLKALFESFGYTHVATYINSGNIVFETPKKKDRIYADLKKGFKKTFGFEVPTLVKTHKEMVTIAKAIPNEWANDTEQRTDVAYLFPEMDSAKIVELLPMQKAYVDIRYVKGAVVWNMTRANYRKSRLDKIISHKSYKYMTIRNVNTARYLAEGK